MERMAAEQGVDVKMTVVGHGMLEDWVSTYIRDNALADTVDLRGYVPHGARLFELLDQHDLLCLPSYTEAVPRVVAEAIVRGTPVLATDGGRAVDFDAVPAFGGGGEVHTVIEFHGYFHRLSPKSSASLAPGSSARMKASPTRHVWIS